MNSVLEETTLVLTHTFHAPPERVFAAWTKPEQLKQWFGPECGHVIDAQMDIQVGGKYRLLMQSPDGEKMTVGGEYREISAPEKLVFTWAWEDDPAYIDHDTLVTIEFLAVGAGTEMRLTHTNFPAVENRNNHEKGWSGTLNKLASFLAA